MTLSQRTPIRKGCGKRRYKDEIAAKIALAGAVRRDGSRREKAERRAYECGRCKGWHLTSQRKPPEARTPLRPVSPGRKAASAPERPETKHERRGKPLKRHARIKPVSSKRAAENRERRAVVAALWPERPLCSVPWCPRLADDIHEPLTRARLGAIDDPGNMAPLCRECHDVITFTPESELGWAYDLGLLKHSWPAEVPA